VESLLLIYQSSGNVHGLEELVPLASNTWFNEVQQGNANVAMMCLLLANKLEQCLDLLLSAKRFTEAAFFARTYLPSSMSSVTILWKDFLVECKKPVLANSIADPGQYPSKFRGFETSVRVQDYFKKRALLPATAYKNIEQFDQIDFVKGITIFILELENGNTLESIFGNIKENKRTASPDRKQTPLQKDLSQTTSAQMPVSLKNNDQTKILSPNRSPSPKTETLPSHKDLQARPASLVKEEESRGRPQTLLQPATKSSTRSSSKFEDNFDEARDLLSDNMSHLSMEVNTTGTNSIRVIN
jgi:coatomer subunit beta'